MLRTQYTLSLISAACLLSASLGFAGEKQPKAPAQTGILKPVVDKIVGAPYIAYAGGLFAMKSFYDLYYKSSVPEDKWNNRFSFKKLLDVKNIAKNEYWQNVRYLYQDTWLGQRYKPKTVKVGDEMFQVRKEDCLPHGVCGHAEAKVTILNKSVEGLAKVLGLAFLLKEHGFIHPLTTKLTPPERGE